MSVLKRALRFVLLAAATASGGAAQGQIYHPFAEPLRFDPDYQLFAPVQTEDLREMSARHRANVGWFLTYDRLHQGFSRPRNETGFGSIDFSWGNRWEAGWQTDHGGWMASVSRIQGPNAYFSTFQSRLNLFEDDDDGDPTNPLFPAGNRNDPQTQERSYDLVNSFNMGSFSNVEFNKTWRFEPYRYGGIFEPLVGIRYSDFKDLARDDDYFVTLTDLDGGPTGVFETLTIDTNTTYNRMLMGQIGFRYRKFFDRWTMNTEFRGFGGQNFQNQLIELAAYRTEYGAIGQGQDPTRFQQQIFRLSKTNEEFVVGMESRIEGVFHLAKHFQLRGGFNLTYIGRGVWRGATLASGANPDIHSQALVMPGFNFGFEVNR